MIQNEIFFTISIEGKTNEASGRAPADPPGAQKFTADPEQDSRVPIAFHPRGILNFQSCYKNQILPVRNDSVTATSLRIKSREAYPNAGIPAAELTGKTETPENEQFLAPGVFAVQNPPTRKGGRIFCVSCIGARIEVPSSEISIRAYEFDLNERGNSPRTITVCRKSESGTRGGGPRQNWEAGRFYMFYFRGLAWEFPVPRDSISWPDLKSCECSIMAIYFDRDCREYRGCHTARQQKKAAEFFIFYST